MRLSSALVSFYLTCTASAHSIKTNFTRCGNYALTSSRKAELDAAASNRTFAAPSNQEVDTYVHVITTKEKQGKYTQQMVDDQMKVMNEAYTSMGFSFKTAGVDFTVQNTWASAAPGSSAEIQLKGQLRQGSYRDLNLYFLSDLGNNLLGFCYFPTANPDANMQTLDGCMNLAGSLPGGEVENYNEGMTAVHESGHWFGLYHTFEGNSCSGSGDQVSDTPMQAKSTTGCPSKQDSCPNKPGVDSIHNYMDYSYDECLSEFTSGQTKRAQALFDKYRAGK